MADRSLRFFSAGNWILVISAFIAAVLLLFHSLSVQRQYDAQMIPYALQFLESLKHGTVLQYFLTPRKYPTLLPILLSVPLGLVLAGLFISGRIHSEADLLGYLYGHPVLLNFTDRFMMFACAAGTAIVLYRCSRRLFPAHNAMSAVVLLLSQTMFLTYSSAVRPHGPIAFFSVLSFFLSLLLAEKKTVRTESAAFLASAAAFASLQSGIFTLLFPVAAFLTVQDRIEWRRILFPRLWGWLAVWLAASLLIGYPSLLLTFLKTGSIGMGLGNTDFDSQPLSFSGLHNWAYFVTGSEVIVLFFVLRRLMTIFSQRIRLPVMAITILLYAVVFSLFFGMISGTAPRMSLPVFALLALFAGPALDKSTLAEKLMFFALVLLVHIRIGWLAVQPDTWQQAHTFLTAHTRGTIATDEPAYFLDIPPSRASVHFSTIPREQWIASQKNDLPDARAFVRVREWRKATVLVVPSQSTLPEGMRWPRCAAFNAGPTDEMMFLWVEMKDGLRLLLEGKSMGPNLSVYCRP